MKIWFQYTFVDMLMCIEEMINTSLNVEHIKFKIRWFLRIVQNFLLFTMLSMMVNHLMKHMVVLTFAIVTVFCACVNPL